MKFVFLGSRYLLALVYLVFGLNFFLNFFAIPPQPEGMQTLMAGLVGSKILLIAKCVEVLFGLSLATNRFVPLMALIAAPVTVIIFWVHLILEPTGLPVGVALLVFHALVFWERRSLFWPLLRPV
jgi:hypothetical protein